MACQEPEGPEKRMESPPPTSSSSSNAPVLHVLVVGFHHKKGCQVEYSHPPLASAPDGDPRSPELPSQWRHLPSLAMPDGSHNYEEDTAFFHLPALDDPRKTVFGISCYRQVDAAKLVNRTEDITRGSVQKSVCVLSRLPLYGQIQVKMALITEAYFREGDFSRLDLIHQTYDNLNACLNDEMLRTQQLYVGLSARRMVRAFRQRALALFKLTLLERKVVFHQSPVKDLSGHLLTLLSLHPGMLEDGLDEAARMVPADTPPETQPPSITSQIGDEQEQVAQEEEEEEEVAKEAKEDADLEDDNDTGDMTKSSSIVDIASEKVTDLTGRLTGALSYVSGRDKASSNQDSASDGKSESQDQQTQQTPSPSFSAAAALTTSELGLPLRVFTGGNLCHPYLSLSYLDALAQPCVRGYVIGATNVLFKQKKGLADVLVSAVTGGEGEVEFEIATADQDLKKALQLTTEDLRFVDSVVKRVSSDEETLGDDVFLDGVGWEGGDEWVRAQFRFYIVCLLRTSLVDDEEGSHPEPKEGRLDYLFNANFMRMWRSTNNYRRWRRELKASTRKTFVDTLPAGHPFSGVLSVNDVRLHLSNAMGSSEGGRKVSQVVSSTGRAVAGGISTAKGAFSSLWSSLRQPAPTQQNQNQEVEVSQEAKEDVGES